MIDYKYNHLYLAGDTEKQIQIKFDNGVITNSDLQQGSFELTESLCSESELRFGCCESSVLKFRVHNIFESLKGKELAVSEILNGNTDEPFLYGNYKVYSDALAADRRYRDIEAYDSMHEILSTDMAEWYNTILPDAFAEITLKAFRKAFVEHFGLEEEEVSLVNDSMVIDRSIEPESISGKDIITSICELNGCFGHIGRDGKFHYVTLREFTQGLYPSETLYPSDNLYPKNAGAEENIKRSRYLSCQYQDFYTQKITGIQIRQEENDAGTTVGTDSNLYVIEDNFLVYGKSATELTTIANNMLSVISHITYRPLKSLKTSGKPYLEVGDRIIVSSTEVPIESYILERTIKGLKGSKDSIHSNGVEKYQEDLNSVSKSIIRLDGKTNKLYRSNEENRLRIEEVNTGLSSEISQKVDEINLSITNLESDVRSEIQLLENEVNLKVTSGEVSSMINVAVNNITISSSQISLEGYTSINNGFSVDNSGNIYAQSGYVGDFLITGGALIGSGVGIYADGDITALNITTEELNLGANSGCGISYDGSGVTFSVGSGAYFTAEITVNGTAVYATLNDLLARVAILESA